METKITKNERGVLKLLLEDGRISDSDMAKKLKISTQAIGKIRKKLEKQGIIVGYSCILDYEKIGLTHFVLACLKYKSGVWQNIKEENIRNYVQNIPRMIFSFMPAGTNIDLIAIYAFENTKEMEKYMTLVKTRNSEVIEYVQTYHFSNSNLLNYSPKKLFKAILDQKEIVPAPITDIIKNALKSK